MKRIAILDYGLGNLASIRNALVKIGAPFIISSDADEIESCSALIIPGVGSFYKGMTNILKANLDKAVEKYASSQRPILGICLGFQMLNKSGCEHGDINGFGFINGHVQKLKIAKNVLLPNIGWQNIQSQKESILLKGIEQEQFYFVHSYGVYLNDQDHAVAETTYGETTFTSVASNENIYGVQFHPEKSREPGLQLIKNFIELAK